MYQQLQKYQSGGTLYDYLKSSKRGWSNKNSADRKTLASQAGIKNYSGTKEQNIELLNFLQSVDNPVVGHKTPTLQQFMATTPNTIPAPQGTQFSQPQLDPRSTFGVLPQSNLSFLNPQPKPKVDLSFLNNFGKGVPYYQEGGVTPRRVDTVPNGFNPLRVDGNRQYYNKIDQNPLQLNASALGARASNDSSYMQGLSKRFPGVDGNTLQQRGFLSGDGAKAYGQYYKPSEDIVYTEKNIGQNVTPARAGRGQAVYDGNKHIAAELFYDSRNSPNSSDGGSLNTANSGARLKFRNDFGYTGEEVSLAAPDIQKYLGTSNTFQTTDGFNELRARAKSPLATKKRGGFVKSKTMNNPYC